MLILIIKNGNRESRELEKGWPRVRRSVPAKNAGLESCSGNESPPLLVESQFCCGVAFVSEQDLILDAIEDAQRILAEHIEPNSRRNPNNRLLFLLDGRDLVAALRPRRAGNG